VLDASQLDSVSESVEIPPYSGYYALLN